MEAIKILQSDWLDLIFEGRNKAYGAYQLRKTYNRRIWIALTFTCGAILFAYGILLFQERFHKEDNFYIVHDLPPLINAPKELPPPQIPKSTPREKVEMKKFTNTLVFKKDLISEVPPIEELVEKRIGSINQSGNSDPAAPAVPVIDQNKQVVEMPKADRDEPFQTVQIEAAVDKQQWQRYLETQLQRYIEDAASQGMAPRQYTVQVRFLVEKDGSIKDVQSLNDPGFGLKKGAEDVVKKGPRWSPGEQNGRKVRSYHTQPITFVIAGQ